MPSPLWYWVAAPAFFVTEQCEKESKVKRSRNYGETCGGLMMGKWQVCYPERDCRLACNGMRVCGLSARVISKPCHADQPRTDRRHKTGCCKSRTFFIGLSSLVSWHGFAICVYEYQMDQSGGENSCVIFCSDGGLSLRI